MATNGKNPSHQNLCNSRTKLSLIAHLADIAQLVEQLIRNE